MKVSVEVIAGRNKGQLLDLMQSPSNNMPYILCEDDVLVFRVQTSEERPNLHLNLHETFIPFFQKSELCKDQPYYEYICEPKKIKNSWRYQALFHNFCGIAELIIADYIDLGFDNFEIKNAQHLHPIEILARKINADRISAMLDFLGRNDGSDLAALARMTRKYSGFQEGDKTITYTLDSVERYILSLEDLLPKITQHPIVKLIQVNHLNSYKDSSQLTEDSINYLINTTEDIYEVVDEEDSLFSIDDRYFAVDKVLEAEIVEECDLYENEVLHGFIHILIQSLGQITKGLKQKCTKDERRDISGYESLFNKIDKFKEKLNRPVIERCNHFISRLFFFKRLLINRINVKKPYLREPIFTHKAKHNLYYRQVFLMMIEWMRFGKPDWSLQNQLNSIENLPKLFEYYLFCLVKEHVLNYSLQFRDALTETLLDGSSYDRFVFKLSEEVKAELLYEPNIYTSDRNSLNAKDRVLASYRNTEAWNRKNNSNNAHVDKNTPNHSFQLRQNSENTKKRLYRRSPDIVLRMYTSNHESLLMLDAKYMTSEKAFHEAMRDCMIKYLHGIHFAATGENKTIGLMIVNPDEQDVTHHFHHDEYTIFGSMPVTPCVMTASIDISKAHHLGSTIQRNIFRIMEMMVEKVSNVGLGEMKTDVHELYKTKENFISQSQDEVLSENKEIKYHEIELKKPKTNEKKVKKSTPIVKQSLAVGPLFKNNPTSIKNEQPSHIDLLKKLKHRGRNN